MTTAGVIDPGPMTDGEMRRYPVAWSLLLALALIKLAVHLLAAGPLAWGYMTDELYLTSGSF